MELNELKSQLKHRLTLGLNVGLKSLDDALSADVLDYTQIEIGLNKIRGAFLALIDNLGKKDLKNQEELSSPKNNELQHRKNNFFKLLEIHFENLNAYEVGYTTDSASNLEIEKGRKAIRSTYKDSFHYAFKNPRSSHDYKHGDAGEFSHFYFTKRENSLEVYFNTIQFILEYILEEEMEKDFYIGILKSILSSSEKSIILYYAISGIDTEFKNILIKSKLIDESIGGKLIDPSHFDLLH